ncbi:hypothetical protein J2T12_003844 [Paenibacillus anaericanus]|uniref:DUF6273 domain-containing protein n=1 Tax=Paenibacillus anaericanus TaxID=170367 RepID=UPI00277FA09B|nr:DUF6273 domain-containing protein [Paenibacillus anaericanus]MDQ0090421.1 hypothetical protein [Paenibacillus anaericanus]
MEEIKIGSALSFGGYNWRVLDLHNDKALIITEDIIEQRPYHSAYKDITWADCALRNYLNAEFYEKFSKADQSRIIRVLNQNSDNLWHGSLGGEDTLDSVFLLSIEEVACHYFGDSRSKLYNPGKNQKYWLQRKDENNSKRIARLLGKEWVWWWWLRSPGRFNVKAAYIHGDGNIGIQGNNIKKGNLSDGKCTGGVRPALWLKL